MKYQRAAREFVASKLTALGGLSDEFAVFAQAYGSDRTKPVNGPTRKRLDATLKATLAAVTTNAEAGPLALPTLGRGSFTKAGKVSSRKPAKLTACR